MSALHVRGKFPLRAAYSRQVLPHVRGFPALRVLCLIRHPKSIRGASPFTVILPFPSRCSVLAVRFRIGPVSGFPLPCLSIRMPCNNLFHRRELMGLPKFLTYLFLHATACGLRRTFSSSPFTDDLVLPSATRYTLGVRNIPISELYQHFRRRGPPCGLQNSLSTLQLSCSPKTSRLRHRRKTRYGWVATPFPTGTLTLQDKPSFAWRETGLRLTPDLGERGRADCWDNLVSLRLRNFRPLWRVIPSLLFHY